MPALLWTTALKRQTLTAFLSRPAETSLTILVSSWCVQPTSPRPSLCGTASSAQREPDICDLTFKKNSWPLPWIKLSTWVCQLHSFQNGLLSSTSYINMSSMVSFTLRCDAQYGVSPKPASLQTNYCANVCCLMVTTSAPTPPAYGNIQQDQSCSH